MEIIVKLDDLLYARRMTLTELADKVGHHARQPLDPQDRQGQGDPLLHPGRDLPALDCQPGDLLAFNADDAPGRREAGTCGVTGAHCSPLP